MSQRAISTLLVAAGCVAAVAMLLVGADLVAASRRGPRWRRRLLGAGLGVLAALGLVPTDSAKAQLPNVMCYDIKLVEPPAAPATPTAAKQALDRLQQQMTLLQKYAAETKLDKAVVEKVLATAEADLASLEKDGKLAGLAENADKRHAAQTRLDARVAIDGLRVRLSPPASLADTPQWQRFLATWKEAEAAAAKDKIDINDQQRLLVTIEGTRTDLGALKQAGLLNEAEAGFLTSGIGSIGLSLYLKQTSGNIDASSPTLMILCYKPMAVLPRPENSLRDLQARLPILRKMADADKLHPAAVERILATCEADLKNLADLKADKDKAAADQVRLAVQVATVKIREKLKAPAPAIAPGK